MNESCVVPNLPEVKAWNFPSGEISMVPNSSYRVK